MAPAHNHSMPQGELQRRLRSSDLECNSVGSGSLLGSCPEPSHLHSARDTRFSHLPACVVPPAPSRVPADWCPCRPTIGSSPEPVYSISQPCGGLCPENALRGPPPTLSPLHSGCVEDARVLTDS